ncbi:hypothetical protein K0M31_002076 [Melipona bicolor]|uniref:Neurotransmitter-gated ion-channel ligand-binding domain-containing protein n=1 Tax=Melipona bicolor TaxID=60889 RepID=A0AA40GH07_9HYME|nr:hypothetical protein K0M31_002076 [Melipona bicolor]
MEWLVVQNLNLWCKHGGKLTYTSGYCGMFRSGLKQVVFVAESLCGRHEKRLLNELLSTYNTLERPVANESEPLEVRFGITLQQIIDVSFQIDARAIDENIKFASEMLKIENFIQHNEVRKLLFIFYEKSFKFHIGKSQQKL